MLLLWLTAALGADTWFYANATGVRVDVRDGTALGVPARLTGAVLARADDPAALAALPGVRAARVLRGDGHLVRLEVEPGVDELALSRALFERPDVRWAHPDLAVPLRATTLPDDPGVPDQWHLHNDGEGARVLHADLGVERAWALTRGAGVRIAVIDSGVDLDHPDLDVVAGLDVVDGDRDPRPDLRLDNAPHGTATAGVAAAIGDNGLGVAGVAWEAEVYAVRLLGGEAAPLSQTWEAFVDAVDAGAAVLNNSWGFSADGCPFVPAYGVLWDAIDYAEENGRGGLGAAVVLASGNGGCDITADGFQEHPAAISVGAIDSRDVLEPYSSWGPWLDVVAPSGGILTTDLVGEPGYGRYAGDPDYYDRYNGTSAAAPMVSGVLALMFSVNDRLTAAQARALLCDTAVRVQPDDPSWTHDGWSPRYGCGRVDATRAVLAARNEAPTAPTLLPTPWLTTSSPILQWTRATDADGDALTYEVRLWPAGTRGQATTVTTTDPWLDVGGIAQPGVPMSWRVTPVDRFGRGTPSADGTFELVPATGGAAGCATSPGAAGWLWLGALGLLRRGGRAAAGRSPAGVGHARRVQGEDEQSGSRAHEASTA